MERCPLSLWGRPRHRPSLLLPAASHAAAHFPVTAALSPFRPFSALPQPSLVARGRPLPFDNLARLLLAPPSLLKLHRRALARCLRAKGAKDAGGPERHPDTVL